MAGGSEFQCNVVHYVIGGSPNAGVNYFLTIAFALCAITTLGIGIWKRTWAFSIAVAAGCTCECVGYVGRVVLHNHPCSFTAFKAQLVTIILGPTIVCIGLYMMLSRLVTSINPSLSRVRPRIYPIFFIPADISCLIVQAVGGGIAAFEIGAKTQHGQNLFNSGNDALIAGVSMQVGVLAGFGLTAADYFIRVIMWYRREGESAETWSLWKNRRFRLFLFAVSGGWLFITIRSIYRIAEMSGGWGNSIMKNETLFIIFESFMVLIACIILTVFPPGIFFADMVTSGQAPKTESADETTDRSGYIEMGSRSGETK